VWHEVQENMKEVLQSRSLADLARQTRQRQKQVWDEIARCASQAADRESC